jgi:hypothetical protein
MALSRDSLALTEPAQRINKAIQANIAILIILLLASLTSKPGSPFGSRNTYIQGEKRISL